MLGPDGYGLTRDELAAIITHPDDDAAVLLAEDGSIVLGEPAGTGEWPRYLDRIGGIRRRAADADLTELALAFSTMIATGLATESR